MALVVPGELSDADYQQLAGMSVQNKISRMRAILTEVAATRTTQQLAAIGPFKFVEGIGTNGEHLFIGSAPPSLQRHTVIVIGSNGEVHKMWPSGLNGVILKGHQECMITICSWAWPH
jgi:hypothetical protein